jgi:hypothetical protein
MALSSHRSFKNPAFGGIFYLRAILIMLLMSVGLKNVNAQAKAIAREPKRDFGKVKKGELLEFEYWIVNTGNQPLLIQPYEAECSCTKVEIPQKPVLPADSSVVKIKFNTGIVYDRQDRLVKLSSNGGVIKLRFKGFVNRVN